MQLTFTVEDKTAGMQHYSTGAGGAFEIVALGAISFEILANGTALDGCQQDPLSSPFLTTDSCDAHKKTIWFKLYAMRNL